MNAVLQPAPALRRMTLDDLGAVLGVEVQAYRFPWTHGNFIDSIVAGYLAQVLWCPVDGLVGYFVAMAGVDELHLLNLTVGPAHQGRGHARGMLDALQAHAVDRALRTIWLEVRASNERARAVYRRRGFAEVGVRKGYYPAPQGRREDAVVMSLAVPATGIHGLD
jgi:ribosomal-protein-alanine N-acetyltransferase